MVMLKFAKIKNFMLKITTSESLRKNYKSK